MELKTSNPASFHSPLSPKKTEAGRMHPWTEVASELINFNVFLLFCVRCYAQPDCKPSYSDIVETPLDGFFRQALPLDMPTERREPFGRDVNV